MIHKFYTLKFNSNPVLLISDNYDDSCGFFLTQDGDDSVEFASIAGMLCKTVEDLEKEIKFRIEELKKGQNLTQEYIDSKKWRGMVTVESHRAAVQKSIDLLENASIIEVEVSLNYSDVLNLGKKKIAI